VAEEPDVRWTCEEGDYSLQMTGSSAAGAVNFNMLGPELPAAMSFQIQGKHLESFADAVEQAIDAASGGDR
jgi:hypothetical protein